MFTLVAMIVMVEDVNVDPTSLLASSAVIRVILRFALQETLGNIFRGLTLQMDKPFRTRRLGSDTQLRGPGPRRISWRSTAIITCANERLEIPSSWIAKDVVVNYSNRLLAEEVTIGLQL
jgi:small-conductance mechanosensitive channel